MVKLRSVTKSYGGFVALDSVDLDIASNQTTALIGPSGCGKSTLLRVILGLIPLSSGVLEVDGKVINYNNLARFRQEVGYVVQDGGLFPHLTARQNVGLVSDSLGKPKADTEKRLQELCVLTRLDPNLLDRYPAELSGGQRQRVGLMRALVLKPKLLLLDEPLGALDPLVRAGLQTDLHRIFQEEAQTVVFVTHDMGEATYLASQIVLMRDGKIVQQGTYKDFDANPAEPFVTEFLNAQRLVGAVPA
jgi:osmoprotectant transport system ATP-binding protein